jgi:HTH-type transcriptional regulator / antitoxin HigA
MAIRPIRNDADHAAALKRIDEIGEPQPGTPEWDEFDVLATLVDTYERQHFDNAPPTPVAAIRFRMEQAGLTRKDLEPVIGSRARVTEVLNGTRPLTLRMVRGLHDRFGIPLESLVAKTVALQKTPGRSRGKTKRVA